MGGFEDKLVDLARRAREIEGVRETEEATTSALDMTFIAQVLECNVFNPVEVVPEFVAELGLQRGEKMRLRDHA